MTHLLTNVAKFYSKLDEFRETGEFTDVTIECEDGGSFRCHRLVLVAASDYFNAMFCSHFKERASEKIVLGEVNAITFGEVLRFVYTGNAIIDGSNVYDVLRASEFFNLPDLKVECISFVERNKTKFTVQHFLNIYLYACATKIDVLVDLLRPHLVNQFEIFSKADDFLEMPFDGLNVIVRSRLSPSSSTLPDADEIVMGAITRWVCHHREDRLQYVNQLVKLITFENVSSEFMKFTVANLFVSADTAWPRFGTSVGPAEVPPLQNTKALHVYVRCARENLIRIFSISSTIKECSFSGEIPASEARTWFRIVALDDFFMYRLNYAGDNPLQGETIEQPTFYAHTSADMRISLPLKDPPLVFGEVSLCPIRNNIYAYNGAPYRSVTRTAPHSRAFEDEEIVRGIYVYNCEVNDWFPVPEMKKKVEYSGMVAHDHTLYLIGGNGDGVVIPTMKYVQAYDHRLAAWRELPETIYDHVGAACCVRRGKIYVCGGLQTTDCERYDPVAGRWETVCSYDPSTRSAFDKAVGFVDQVWLFDRNLYADDYGSNRFSNFLISEEKFDQYNKRWVLGWRVSSRLEKSVNQITTKASNIVDCVVF